MAFCSKCGTEIPEGSQFCQKCGTPVQQTQDSTGSNNPYNGQTASNQYASQQTQQHFNQTQPQSSDSGHGLAIGSLVCGIIGTVMWFFGYTSIVSIVLGIIGLVLASNAKKSGNTEGVRTAGFVLSIISIVGGCIVFFYVVVVLSFVGSVYNTTMNSIYNFMK